MYFLVYFAAYSVYSPPMGRNNSVKKLQLAHLVASDSVTLAACVAYSVTGSCVRIWRQT